MAFAAAVLLSQLLAHMREVDGGLSSAHIVSTSQHPVGGMPAEARTSVQGLRYRIDQCTGAICLGTYFDGERLFSVNINGTALPLSNSVESGIRALRIVGTLQFLDPQFTRTGGVIYDGGTATFESHTVRKLYVSDEIARPMIVYVDPKTGLVAGAQDLGGDGVYAMRDYRKVGRFELPFEVDRNGELLERYDTREVAADSLPQPKPIPVALSGTSPSFALDPQSVSPLGTCTIGGFNVPCLIDSGNSAMSMSLELAEQLNLQPVGMMRIAGLGNYATEVVHAPPLTIGDARLDPANYVVLSDIHRYGYDIVIGADLLASVPMTIDNPHHRVYFGGQTPADQSGATVPLQFENFIPVVNVALGGQVTSLAIDTGDQSNINLGYDFYEQHPQLFQITKNAEVSGVGGESVELMGEIPTVRIGPLVAQNQQIGTTKTLKGTANGHIGAGFLSKYAVTLDYAHAVMRLSTPKPK